MRGISRTASKRSLSMFVAAAAIAAGLSGCGTVDDALFGSDEPEPVAAAPSGPQALPGTLDGGTGAVPMAGSADTSTAGPVGTTGMITPVTIAPVTNTGTAVGQTVQALAGNLSSMQGKIMAAASRLSGMEASNAQFAGTYFQDKAQMTTRLQVGTTRGNPELVQQWNAAQSALDSLTGNINAMNNLGTEVSDISSRAHYILNTVQATYNVSGAVDEDHRQLDILADETNQTIIIIDRLLRQVTGDIQRQTAYVANERASLTTLASAIKSGELYGTGLGGAMTAGAAPVAGVPSGAPLVTIRFDHPHVDYKQILYSAVDQALQSRPEATFSVVAVSPTRGSAPAVQLAQSEAQRHAQQVLRAMTDMGVPGARLAIASQTDPTVHSTQVRVYVR